jgi:formamidase
VFNTTALVGPGGVLAKYRKLNTWIPWEVHTSPHDLPDYPDEIFPVVDTEIGKLGVAICYDWLFPETLRELAFRGAEVLIRVSAYMDPWGTQQPMDWWTSVNRTRALENTAYVVAANQGAEMQNYPPFSWPGGSMVVDYDGRILAQVDPGAGRESGRCADRYRSPARRARTPPRPRHAQPPADLGAFLHDPRLPAAERRRPDFHRRPE